MQGKRESKTYSSGDSHVVTNRSTSPPVRSLSTAERTGCPILCDLWPYVLVYPAYQPYMPSTAGRRPERGAQLPPVHASGPPPGGPGGK
jgi:hypothetical protein